MKFPKIPNCELYLCGGAVRDYLLGKEPKDLDFVVLTNYTYEELLAQLHEMDNVKVFKADAQFYTIRCLFDKEPIDLVFPRKERGYTDGRHPDSVERVSTLYEDSLRRDFTINAMYLDEDLNLIDYHNGQKDLEDKYIRTVQDPEITFKDDYLRILRAIRFSCQLRFGIAYDTQEAMNFLGLTKVSMERVKDELNKALKFNERAAMSYISQIELYSVLKEHNLRLELTNKK